MKQLKPKLLVGGLAMIAGIILIGQFTTLFSKYSLRLPADSYTEHNSNVGVICAIGYDIDKPEVLKQNGFGWPVVQSTSILSNDIVPDCVGDVRLGSNFGQAINLGILAIIAGASVIIIRRQRK